MTSATFTAGQEILPVPLFLLSKGVIEVLKPNIDAKQRWLRGLGGTALILASLTLPKIPDLGRISLAALGFLGIAQALSGI